MRHKNFGERHIVRLESGECAVERLMELAATKHIGFANVSAAGAVKLGAARVLERRDEEVRRT